MTEQGAKESSRKKRGMQKSNSWVRRSTRGFQNFDFFPNEVLPASNISNEGVPEEASSHVEKIQEGKTLHLQSGSENEDIYELPNEANSSRNYESLKSKTEKILENEVSMMQSKNDIGMTNSDLDLSNSMDEIKAVGATHVADESSTSTGTDLLARQVFEIPRKFEKNERKPRKTSEAGKEKEGQRKSLFYQTETVLSQPGLKPEKSDSEILQERSNRNSRPRKDSFKPFSGNTEAGKETDKSNGFFDEHENYSSINEKEKPGCSALETGTGKLEIKPQSLVKETTKKEDVLISHLHQTAMNDINETDLSPKRKKRGRPKKVSLTEESSVLDSPDQNTKGLMSISTTESETVWSDQECGNIEKRRRPSQFSVTEFSMHENSDQESEYKEFDPKSPLIKKEKKRGRPKKATMHVQDVSFPSNLSSTSESETLNQNMLKSFTENSKKKRGRPKKIPVSLDTSSSTKSDKDISSSLLSPISASESFQHQSLQKTVKKRGRPKKIPVSLDASLNKKSNQDVSPSLLSPISASESFQYQSFQKTVKKRGRPKKIPVSIDASLSTKSDQDVSSSLLSPISASENFQHQSLQKTVKKRGRPKKIPVSLDASLTTKSDQDVSPNILSALSASESFLGQPLQSSVKKRGRPKKTPADASLNKISQQGLDSINSLLLSSSEDQHFQKTHFKQRVKKRGRPRKDAGIEYPNVQSSGITYEPTEKRPRKKRPRKSVHISSWNVMWMENRTVGEVTDEGSFSECDHTYIPYMSEKKESNFVKKKKGRPRKDKNETTSMFNEVELTEWKEAFASRILKCLKSDCLEAFKTFLGLFSHLNKHKTDSKQNLYPLSLTLPCHVCEKTIGAGTQFLQHMRLIHRDVFDLAQLLESDAVPRCFNYNCNQEVETYDDCIKHGHQCGSLIKCQKCGRSYKTRTYFNSHSCVQDEAEIDNAELERKMTAKRLSSLVISGPRKSATRALSAICKGDSSDENSRLSESSNEELALEAGSNDGEDSDEFEEDEFGEEEDDDFANEGKQGEENCYAIPTKSTSTSVPKSIRSAYRKKMGPHKQYFSWLKDWYESSHVPYLFPEWNFSVHQIVYVDKSEANDFFPKRSVSSLFNIIYETATNQCKTDFTRLPIFQTLPPLKGSQTSTMFVGGSILAMEWCPIKGESDQYLAIIANGNEMSTKEGIELKKYLIQIWRIPRNQEDGKHDEAKMLMGITVDFGPVYCMKWCPSGSFEQAENCPIKRLGILAISGVDSFIRIISVPHPVDCLNERKHQMKTDANTDLPNTVFVKLDPALNLVTSRAHFQKGNCTNPVTCFQWQPANGHKKCAAGFQDGSVCIWNIATKSSLLRFSSKDGKSKYLLPFARINAHTYSVNGLSWCPTDENFIATVSFEKTLKVFDIRSKHSIPGILTKKKDEVFNCIPAGSRYVDLMLSTSQRTPFNFSELITAHNAGCKGLAFSEWLNGFLTSCDAGEVVFRPGKAKRGEKSGSSMRVPIYRIESTELSTAEDQLSDQKPEAMNHSTKTANQITESLNRSEKSTNRFPNRSIIFALDEIRKGAAKLEEEISRQQVTFKDSNFFEFRNKPFKRGPELLRIRNPKVMQSSFVRKQEIRQISQVQFNPNYGSHHMLASGGVLGLVRIHHFTNWI